MAATKTDLPRIIRFRGTHDSGEFGNASCPHCGADGRYVHEFDVITAEGEIRQAGAMAGCFKLFPIAFVAQEHQRLDAKAREYAKKGWSLNRFDADALDAIDKFYGGLGSEDDINAYLRGVRAAATNWRQSRGR